MLRVTQPYVRETTVRDEKEGRNIVIKIEPPGNTISFRLRGGRTTWYLDVKHAYHAARYTANPPMMPSRPKAPESPNYQAEILSILRTKGSLNIAAVVMHLKERGIKLDRNIVGQFLEMLKQLKQVSQSGFKYSPI